MTEPGYYWFTVKGGTRGIACLDADGTLSLHGNNEEFSLDEPDDLPDGFTLGPRIPSAEEIERWQDWPTCPECHFPLVRHVEGEPSHENIFWTCPEHGEFLVKQRYRVIER